MVTHPAPPQTRTCAMHAYGSSSRAATALLQSPGVLWSGLVSSMSLPYVPPADALLDGAFPPVGRLGLTSPPSSVLCASPIPCLLPYVRGVPEGLVARAEAPGHARAFGHPVPHSGDATRRQVALHRSPRT